MKDNLRLYVSIMQFIGQTGMTFNDRRNRVTLVWAVVGLIMSKSIHLSAWLVYRIGDTQAASKVRQFSRWLHNPKLDAGVVYHALASHVLLEWQTNPLEIALDTSVVWNRYVIVRLAAIYRGRALPLAWTVLEQSSASVSFANYAPVLHTASALIPSHCTVVLLADRGFVDVALMQLAVELGWHFTLRAKTSIIVYRAFKPSCPLGLLMPAQGQIRLYPMVQVTERRFGPVHLALGHVRTRHGYETWALISDRPTTLYTFEEYGRRFDIEENFLDDKSAGFQLSQSELRSPEALARLCLILAVATLYLVSTGTAITAMNLRLLVDPHWHRGLSYLQIGWRWVVYALTHATKLLTFLWLEPGLDPEPVFASRRQARTPTFAFSAIYIDN
jgi:hypothetical protein